MVQDSRRTTVYIMGNHSAQGHSSDSNISPHCIRAVRGVVADTDQLMVRTSMTGVWGPKSSLVTRLAMKKALAFHLTTNESAQRAADLSPCLRLSNSLNGEHAQKPTSSERLVDAPWYRRVRSNNLSTKLEDQASARISRPSYGKLTGWWQRA